MGTGEAAGARGGTRVGEAAGARGGTKAGPFPVLAEPVAPDGARLVVRVHARPDPTAPVVVVLPAMGTPARHYTPLARALHRRGATVVTVDPRGHGESVPVPARGVRFGYRELVEHDIGAVLDAVARAFPGAPRLILGHSLGGQLGLVHCGLLRPRLDGVVLVASGSAWWRTLGPSGARWLARSLLCVAGAELLGYWPGRRLGFGGRESVGLMRDWARQLRTGRYAADHEEALRASPCPCSPWTSSTTPWHRPGPWTTCARSSPRPVSSAGPTGRRTRAAGTWTTSAGSGTTRAWWSGSRPGRDSRNPPGKPETAGRRGDRGRRPERVGRVGRPGVSARRGRRCSARCCPRGRTAPRRPATPNRRGSSPRRPPRGARDAGPAARVHDGPALRPPGPGRPGVPRAPLLRGGAGARVAGGHGRRPHPLRGVPGRGGGTGRPLPRARHRRRTARAPAARGARGGGLRPGAGATARTGRPAAGHRLGPAAVQREGVRLQGLERVRRRLARLRGRRGGVGGRPGGSPGPVSGNGYGRSRGHRPLPGPSARPAAGTGVTGDAPGPVPSPVPPPRPLARPRRPAPDLGRRPRPVPRPHRHPYPYPSRTAPKESAR